jgi:uncharacterized circularly permuted ATP-grasp superfamily protein
MGRAAFDEMNGLVNGATPSSIRDAYGRLKHWLDNTPPDVFDARRSQAELFFRRIGITFAVYGDNESTERLIPFDIIPRVLTMPEWVGLERGLKQRVTALNAFLADVYGPQECIRAGVIPEDLVLRNPHYRPEMIGFEVPHGVYVHIAGIDVVRVDESTFYVLEDNARTPSGVSYMLENREAMMRLFPELFARHRVAPVENYPDALLATLRSVAPRSASRDPTAVLPHARPFQLRLLRALVPRRQTRRRARGGHGPLREGRRGLHAHHGRPHAGRRDLPRLDDEFLDPLVFRPDSMLGVPGLMGAYQAGNVTLANAVGTGVSDDKAVYSYMPDIVRFFTGEEPILNNVPTWRCREKEALSFVLDHLHELVVKEVNGSGGYGMLVGPHATKREIEEFGRKLRHMPDGFIAQPTLALSTCPTFVASGVAPRHVDLRPFVLSGADDIRIVPGGLTRVASRRDRWW